MHSSSLPSIIQDNRVFASSQSEMVVKKIDNRPFENILVGGVNVKSLFDTGSTVTLVSRSVYSQMTPSPKLIYEEVGLSTADGSPVKVLGKCEVDIKIKDQNMRRPIIVVECLPAECIIGMDTMISEKIHLNIPLRKVERIQQVSQVSINSVTEILKLPNQINISPRTDKTVFLKMTRFPENVEVLV